MMTDFEYIVCTTSRGDVHVSPAELRQAGVYVTEIPRWTNGYYLPMFALAPSKNVDLLHDFIRLYGRD